MTVSNQTSSVSFQGNGVTTVFPYAFLVPTADDLTVLLYDSTTFTEVEIDPADYSVSGLGDPAGGNVTYNPSGTPIPSTKWLTVRRIVSYIQSLDLTNQSSFYPTVLEAQLDLMVMQIQQLAEDVSNAFVLPAGAAVTTADLLAAAISAAADAASAAASAAAAAASVATLTAYTGAIRIRAATTANITIATALNNGDTLDGVVLATGDLVLVKDQAAPAENGIYVVGTAPARAAAFDTFAEHAGALVVVQEGTANGDTIWICTTNAAGTLGTTAISWTRLTITGEMLTASYPTLVSLEGLTLAQGDLLYATAADTLARLAKGTGLQALRMNAGATAPEWYTPAGGITNLGNKTTTSGTSQSLTGLTLTSYKFLRIVFNAISASTSGRTISLNGVVVSAAAAGGADTWSGFIDVDLNTGIFISWISMTGAAPLVAQGASGLTTGSTSVTITLSSSSFDAGSFDVYGLT